MLPWNPAEQVDLHAGSQVMNTMEVDKRLKAEPGGTQAAKESQKGQRRCTRKGIANCRKRALRGREVSVMLKALEAPSRIRAE